MDLVTGPAAVYFHGVFVHHPVGGNAQVALPLGTVESNVFATGGHNWIARFVCQTYAGGPRLSLSLHLSPGPAEYVQVKASLQLSVIDPRGSLAPTTLYSLPPHCFVSSAHNLSYWYVDDHSRLLLQIAVTVVPEDDPNPAETTTIILKPVDADDVPSSDMLDQLGEVFKTREGADVTFSVASELVQAHKIVLAMRSPVFKAQLYGEMKESGAQPIQVHDMTADTFRALLRYIYTDRQDGEEGNHDKDHKQVWELLMAADRYSVERLKLICERVLSKRLDAQGCLHRVHDHFTQDGPSKQEPSILAAKTFRPSSFGGRDVKQVLTYN